jgi:hypothetical protein
LNAERSLQYSNSSFDSISHLYASDLRVARVASPV